MTTENKPTILTYNGYDFTQDEVQHMLDNKAQYRHADNLPKWIAVNLLDGPSHPTYEVAFNTAWAFLRVFTKI